MRRLPVFLVLAALLALPAFARACAGCAESVTVGKGQSGEILAGFSLSVLFLLGAVVFTVGGLLTLVVRTVRAVEASRVRVPAERDPSL